jgi:hypothetical protein
MICKADVCLQTIIIYISVFCKQLMVRRYIVSNQSLEFQKWKKIRKTSKKFGPLFIIDDQTFSKFFFFIFETSSDYDLT